MAKNNGENPVENPRMRRMDCSTNPETPNEAYKKQRERNNIAAKQSRHRRSEGDVSRPSSVKDPACVPSVQVFPDTVESFTQLSPSSMHEAEALYKPSASLPPKKSDQYDVESLEY
ncbi:unnamed protein product [Diatraea saccharalis]|uniref:BZIP domain-containing protein n=1 Tax=Diatraea saccharalis TaxID=40085 RepID=A0A9N9WE62_9NEOP|nr:unnamed protein product [Diatraea saccharalis]